MPNRTPPNNTGKRVIKINAISQAKLIRLLIDGTRSCRELAEDTGLHYVTVLQYTRELYREGAVHICHWGADAMGIDKVKVYKLGLGKDAKRHCMTNAQRSERYRRTHPTRHLQKLANQLVMQTYQG